MIRWKYLAPRLAVVTSLCLFWWFGLDHLVRWSLISTGQSVTGAKVEISELKTSLANGKLRMQNIQIANPHDPDRNLMEAREAVLYLEASSLLKRKFVVSEGRLSGVRIDTPRETPGALAATERQLEIARQLAELGSRWLEHFKATLQYHPEDNLETVRLAKEMLERWPHEYQDLRNRVEALDRRLAKLKLFVDNPGNNPLRNLEAFENVLAELDAFHQDLETFHGEIERLKLQLPRDRDTLLAAKERDKKKIQQLLALRHPDAKTLSEYLLGPENGGQVAQILGWIQWARQHIPASLEDIGPERMRGFNIAFGDEQPTPNFLIRTLAIDGEGKIGGDTLRFHGEATGLTTQPATFGQPAVFRLTTDGPAKLKIVAVIDRTTDVPWDRITVDCPAISQPSRVLGRPDQFSIAVSPSNLRLHVELELRQEKVSGTLRLTQEGLEITPQIADAYGGERVNGYLQSALCDVHEIDVELDLAGTIDKPTWQLRSNLGSQIQQGLALVLQSELDARRDELTGQLDRFVDGEFAKLEQLVQAKQQEVLHKLQLGDAEIAQLKGQVATRVGLPDRFRRAEAPLRELLRR